MEVDLLSVYSIFFFFTYEEVGSGCRLSKLLLHVFGFEGEQADERVELQDAPTEEQEVGRSSQQALQRGKEPCGRTSSGNTSNHYKCVKYQIYNF